MAISSEDFAKQVIDSVDEDEIVDFARRIGEIPSRIGVDAEENVAQFVVQKLQQAGIETELREVFSHRPNALGFIRGSGNGVSLMLNGHLDTGPYCLEPPVEHVSSLEDGVLRTHGMRNMKAGVASMVMAAVTLARNGFAPHGDLIVATVMGHHQGSLGSLRLIEEGLIPDYAIFPEPTDMGIRTIQTGNVALKIHIFGRTGPTGGRSVYHKYSRLEHYPIDAVQQAFKVIQALESVDWRYTPFEQMPDLPMIQVRGIQGGYGRQYIPSAFVPDFCSITLGVLVVPGQTPYSVKEDIERTLNAIRRGDPSLRFEVEIMGLKDGEWTRPPLQADDDSDLVKALRQRHSEVMGSQPNVGAILPNSYFGCDAQPFWIAGCNALSYGPGGHAYLPVNRGSVCVSDLIACAKVIALVAIDLCMKERDALCPH